MQTRLDGDGLNEEQRKWQKQYRSNIGAKEFLRLFGAIMAWVVIGALISAFINSFPLFLVFFLVLFAFAFVGPRWKPAYHILRKILGNEDLPAEAFPGAIARSALPSRPWWSYLPGLWWMIISLILLFFVMRYFLSR